MLLIMCVYRASNQICNSKSYFILIVNLNDINFEFSIVQFWFDFHLYF